MKYGFVGLRDVAPPMVSDGMDEKDPVVGMLLFSGFASYQPFDPPWSQNHCQYSACWLPRRGLNYESGSGGDNFKANATLHGPVVGLAFTF